MIWRIARSLLGYLLTKEALERVIATVFYLYVKLVELGKIESVTERVRRALLKISHQCLIVAAAIQDNRITVQEAAAILNAWSRGESTPRSIEDRVVPPTDLDETD